MFSLKDSIRKTITLTIASALATTVFVGCSKSDPNESSLPVNTTAVTTTVAIPEELTPGITDTGVEDKGIQFKYWYDGDLAAEAQKLSTTVTNAITLTGAHFMDMEELPIRTDTDGNEYIISGRTQVYLSHGKMASKDLYAALRDSEGFRYYTVLPSTVKDLLNAFGARMLASGKTQAATYDERLAADDELSDIIANTEYDLFLNNIELGITYSSDAPLVDISTILQSYALGCFISDTQTLRLYTAYGNVDIAITPVIDGYALKYSTGEEYGYVSPSELSVSDSYVAMSLAAMQKYLGAQIEVYDDFINIVTDNKDILTDDHSIDIDAALEVSDSNLNDYDTTQPIDTTPATPEPEPTEEPEPDLAETLEESEEPAAPEKPAETTKPSKPAQTTKPTSTTKSNSDTKQPKPNYDPPRGTEHVREGDWVWVVNNWIYDPDHEYKTPEEAAEIREKEEAIFNGEHQLGEGEDLTGLEDLFESLGV